MVTWCVVRYHGNLVLDKKFTLDTQYMGERLHWDLKFHKTATIIDMLPGMGMMLVILYMTKRLPW